MKPLLFCAILLFALASKSISQNVTTAGNGLYKPTTTSLALSDGSNALTSPVAFDYGVSNATFEIKKGGASYLYVNNAGSVGIGISNLSAKLDIRGNTSSGTNNTMMVTNSSATELFRIKDNGKVSIGPDINHSALFTINGLSYFNTSAYYGNSSSSFGLFIGNGATFSGNEIGVYSEDGDAPMVVYDNDIKTLMFGINGLMSLDNVNNTLGIGKFESASNNTKVDINGSIFCNKKIFIGTADGLTTTKIAPYALAVNGDAIFNKVKVKLYGVWPDYVFEDNYTLKSLNEVEQYIKKYKHLPGLASAEELNKEESIDIGETQATLLKKIEELTLYLIDINKKVEILMEENKILKAKNK